MPTYGGNASNNTLTGDVGGVVADDSLAGFGGADTLYGGSGNDTLDGGAGQDTLDGGAGADTMQGGAGRDTYIVDNVGDAIQETGTDVDTVKTTLGSYTLGANLENLVAIGAGPFTGTGNTLANAITGGASNDSLYGGSGDDTLTGGGGNDSLDGGAGANDTAVFSGASAQYTITRTSATTATVAHTGGSHADGTDTLANVEKVQFTDGTFTLFANNAPTAVADAFSGAEDQPITGNVLTNDRDFEGQTLSVTPATVATTHGSVTIGANGVFTYTPAANFHGTDSFSYTVNDTAGGSSVGSVALTVSAVNDAPVAAPDTATLGEDATTPVTGNVLSNDTDADKATDNDTLAVQDAGVRQGAHGVLTLNAAGGYSYALDTSTVQYLHTGDTVSDVFNYTAVDSQGATSTSTLTVTITGSDDAPVLTADTATIGEDATAPVTGSVTGNDTDAENDTLAVTNPGTYTGAHGALTLGANGAFSYAVNTASVQYLHDNETTSDAFTYAVSDGHGGTASSTLTVTINGSNDAPVAVADTATATEDTATVTGSVTGNDTDAENDGLTVTNPGTYTGAHGVLTLGTGGAYSYAVDTGSAQALNVGQHVEDVFTYAVSDGHGGAASSTLTVSITGSDDAPVAVADAATTASGAPVAIDVLANDTDVDDPHAALTLTGVGSAAHGTVTVQSGKAVYTPTAGFSGTDTFTYTVSDGHPGGTATGSVSVTVTDRVTLHHGDGTADTYFHDIQAAVTAAAVSGDSIDVAAGTYREQVVVDGKTLTIHGADGAKIEAPDALTKAISVPPSGTPLKYALIGVENGSHLTVDNIDLDGRGLGDQVNSVNGVAADFDGVAVYNADVLIENGAITGFRNGGASGAFDGIQHGNGVYAYVDAGAHTIEVSHEAIDGFQKTGVVVNGAGATGLIHDSTITGGGATDVIAQNGVQIGFGASGTVADNHVSAIGYTPAATTAAGVLGYESATLTVTGNTIDMAAGSTAGVDVDSATGTSTVTGNIISHAQYGLLQEETVTSVVVQHDNTYTSDTTNFGFHPDVGQATAYAVTGTSGADDLRGSDGADTLDGAGGDDSLYGGAGADSLSGGAGSNAVDGGAGVDTVSYASGALSFDGAHWVVTGTGFTDTLTGVEKVVIAGVTHLLVDHAGGGFQTIGEAVAQATADGGGEVVELAGGTTYAEQVLVDGLDLTIEGVGAGATIKAPAGSLQAHGTSDHFGGDIYGVVTAMDGATLSLSNLTVDGDYAADPANGRTGVANADEPTGVAYLHASGAMDQVHVQHTGNSANPDYFGVQHGSGILVDSGSSGETEFTLTDSTVDTFQKTGLLIWGADVDISGSHISGIGPTALTAQNDIQIAGSEGSITGNTIDGFGYTLDTQENYASSGIIAYQPTGTLHIDDNTIVGSAHSEGLDLSENLSGSTVTVTGNSFDGVETGVYAYAYQAAGISDDTQITGNAFTGITGTGLHFDAEEIYVGPQYGTYLDYSQAGTAFADSLAGSLGSDTFSGLGGDDVLVGRGGNDSLDGGAGTDTAVYAGPRADYAVTVTGGSFTEVRDTGGEGEGDDTLAGVEKLTFGSGASATTLDLSQHVRLFHGTELVGTYDHIQDAIGAASAGDRITVAAGTYAEHLTVDKANLTIEAASGAVLQGTFFTDNAVPTGTSLATFIQTHGYSQAAGDGVTITANGATISGLQISGFANGVRFINGVNVNGVTLSDVDFVSNINGIEKSTTAGVDHLTITGGSFSDGYLGIDAAKSTAPADKAVGNLDHVTITGTDFHDLDRKGIYVETLSNAHITGVTMENVGQYGSTSADSPPNGQGGNGIDLNLKNGDYAHVQIDNFHLTDTGASDANGTTASSKNGGAIVIEARSDGGAYGAAPATLTDVTIHDGTIDGHTSVGVQLGEPGKADTTSLSVSNVAISGAQHTVQLGEVVNEGVGVFTVTGTTGADSYQASANSDGAFSLSGGDGADTLGGGSANDTLVGGAGSDELHGGAGIDTATYGAGATLAFTGGHWQVTTAPGEVDTLYGVEKVVIGAQTYELVDGSGPDGGYQSVQAGIDAAATSGDIVEVAAGTYDFSAGGLNLSKSLTIQGAQAGVAGASHVATGETVFAGPSSGLLFNLGSAVDVTVDGIKATGSGMTYAAAGQHVTFTDSVFDLATTSDNAFYTGASNVSFTFTNNALTQTGYAQLFQLFEGTQLTVTGNTFTGVDGGGGSFGAGADNTTPLVLNVNGHGVISGNSFSHVDIGVLVASTSGLSITGNTFDDIHRADPANQGYGAGVVLYGPPYGGHVAVEGNTFTDADAAVRTTTAAGGTLNGIDLSLNGDVIGTGVGLPGYASCPACCTSRTRPAPRPPPPVCSTAGRMLATSPATRG